MDKGVPFASTIHSALSLKPVTMHRYSSADYLRRREILQSLETILIDEVSMINCSLMDWIIRLLSDAEKDRHYIRLVLFGDVLQLPPACKITTEIQPLWESKYGSNFFFFNAERFDKNRALAIMMNHVYRQTDSTFEEALTSLRKEHIPQSALDIINSRVIEVDAFRKQVEGDFLTIVSTNREKDKLNEIAVERLKRQGKKAFEFDASITGIVDASTVASVPSTVTLYEGEKVMLTANTDTYKNGAVGTIIGFTNTHLPCVRLSSGKEVIVAYKEMACYTPVTADDGLLGYDMTGSVSQIAAVPAYASTIHKTQGLTLDALYYQVNNSWIPPAGVYVALSRARTLNDIGLSRAIRRTDVRFPAEATSFLKTMISA